MCAKTISQAAYFLLDNWLKSHAEYRQSLRRLACSASDF
jgi:hypothetical protein